MSSRIQTQIEESRKDIQTELDRHTQTPTPIGKQIKKNEKHENIEKEKTGRQVEK